MELLDLPPEILLLVFRHCSSIGDVTNLSRTCWHLQTVLSASQKTLVYYHVAELQFGPLHDIIQLVTLNSSQPVSLLRKPARSTTLLQQLVAVGRVAKRWEDIYPSLEWDTDFASRRSLSHDERYRLRRALYRYWLYTRAFHNPLHPRTARQLPHRVRQRTTLLQNWPMNELIELGDFHDSIRYLIETKICPSDGRLRSLSHYDEPHSSCGHCKQPSSLVAPDDVYSSRGHCVPSGSGVLDATPCAGWGDSLTHYYVVEDLLKLDPGVVLWLYDHSQKWQVQHYLDTLGDWFFDNGGTLSETLSWVLDMWEPPRSLNEEYTGLGIVQGASDIDLSDLSMADLPLGDPISPTGCTLT